MQGRAQRGESRTDNDFANQVQTKYKSAADHCLSSPVSEAAHENRPDCPLCRYAGPDARGRAAGRGRRGLEWRQGTRHAALRGQRGHPGLFRARRRRTLARVRRGFLSCCGGGGPERSGKGRIRAAARLRPLPRAADAQDRPVAGQYHLDPHPRSGVEGPVSRNPVLRWPGIHGPERRQHCNARRPRWCDRLRGEGNDAPAHPGGVISR